MATPWWFDISAWLLPTFADFGLNYEKMGFETIWPKDKQFLDRQCVREQLWAQREGLTQRR